MKVLLTRKLPEIAEKILIKNGFEVVCYEEDKLISRRELLQLGGDADGILSLLTDRFDSGIINKLDSCKVISNYAVGYNNIDIKAASEKGIVVTNTPDILTDATADLAMALLLGCARRIPESDKFTRDGLFNGWKPKLLLGIELRGKTLGIIGAGRIGQAVARRAKAFGMEIVYTNKSKKDKFESETGARKLAVSQLLKQSDFISLHLPLTDKTRLYLDSKRLDLLKPGAVLINTARGEIIDEKHLVKLLRTKKVFAAGLDVYTNEPKIYKEFFKLDNVILLPHTGSATVEARNKMAELAANNIVNVLKEKEPLTPVNRIRGF